MDKGNSSTQSVPCISTKRRETQLNSDCEDNYNTPEKIPRNMDTKQNTKRMQKYKTIWENEYGAWLTKDPQNEYNGKCKLCGVTFTIASGGIGQVSRKTCTCVVSYMVLCMVLCFDFI